MLDTKLFYYISLCHIVYIILLSINDYKWSLRSIEANMLDCDIIMHEFELQLNFWTNTLEKGMKSLIPTAMY